MLRSRGIAVVPHAFADHHRFTPEDFAFGSDLPVLMTEKDAVKCTAFAGDRHFSVPISADLPEALWFALLAKLRGSGGRRDMQPCPPSRCPYPPAPRRPPPA